MPAKNYASTRFSGLEDINTGNVASLKLAWSFSTGVVRGHEGGAHRGKQHDVHRYALSEHRLCPRSDATGWPSQMEV
jgi:hypothetical protein